MDVKKGKSMVEYPIPLGKTPTFLVDKKRHLGTATHPYSIVTPYCTMHVVGETLNTYDQSVVIAMLLDPIIQDGKMGWRGTAYRLLKRVYPHRHPGNDDYTRLRASLTRLSNTTVFIEKPKSEKYLFDHNKVIFKKQPIIHYVEMETEKGKVKKIRVIFATEFAEWAKQHLIGLIKLNIWNKLSPTGKALYTFLISQRGTRYTMSVLTRALQIRFYRGRARVKEKLAKQLQILQKEGIVEAYGFDNDTIWWKKAKC